MPDNPSLAHIAAGLLSRREHSVAELRAKLLKRSFPQPEVDRCLADFTAKGFLSDERYAQQFIAMSVRRGHGPLKIANELRGKGVEDSMISLQMEHWNDEWAEVCLRVAEKKFGDERVTDRKDLAKRLRFLQSRGFNSEQIRLCQNRWNSL